jgi:hypothetical protein
MVNSKNVEGKLQVGRNQVSQPKTSKIDHKMPERVQR